MLAPTHLVAGQTAYLVACLAAGHPPAMAEAWAAAVCALLPDLDKRQGLVGRLFPYLSEPLEHRFGHRTLTHSLLSAVALGAALWPLLPQGWWLAVAAGFASHPLADMMTPAGVAWFWPGRWRCVLPGNERYRMRAMGWGELAFAAALGAVAVPLAALAVVEQGTGGIIKAAIGDIAAARARYDAEKGANRWTLRVEGRDNRSYADIGGEYPVIGPWQAAGFLVRDADGRPRTVCRSPACDWYADHAVAVTGAAEATTMRRLAAARTSVAALRAALAPLEAAGEVYLSGTLKARGVEPQPPTVAVDGDAAALAYATPDVLEAWPPVAVQQVDVVVQVRHPPDEEPPKLRLVDSAGAVLPPLLLQWVE